MEPTAEDTRRDWSIQDIARIAGTTSRTLRHYHRIGLLRPSRVGSNGYRYYDGAALLQLQRILLLRELGGNSALIGLRLHAQELPRAAPVPRTWRNGMSPG